MFSNVTQFKYIILTVRIAVNIQIKIIYEIYFVQNIYFKREQYTKFDLIIRQSKEKVFKTYLH